MFKARFRCVPVRFIKNVDLRPGSAESVPSWVAVSKLESGETNVRDYGWFHSIFEV